MLNTCLPVCSSLLQPQTTERAVFGRVQKPLESTNNGIVQTVSGRRPESSLLVGDRVLIVEQQDYSTIFSMLQRLSYTLFVLLFLLLANSVSIAEHQN
jgi:hypothetical protein